MINVRACKESDLFSTQLTLVMEQIHNLSQSQRRFDTCFKSSFQSCIILESTSRRRAIEE